MLCLSSTEQYFTHEEVLHALQRVDRYRESHVGPNISLKEENTTVNGHKRGEYALPAAHHPTLCGSAHMFSFCETQSKWSHQVNR